VERHPPALPFREKLTRIGDSTMANGDVAMIVALDWTALPEKKAP
jgi:hypothetical protein